jgi:hypothetical protein
MKNDLLVISEGEKERILGMHKRASNKNYLFEAELFGSFGGDKDYDYKKDGNVYSFKLKDTPTSDKAKEYKTQGKFTNWTVAKDKGLEAIKKKESDGVLIFKEVAPKSEPAKVPAEVVKPNPVVPPLNIANVADSTKVVSPFTPSPLVNSLIPKKDKPEFSMYLPNQFNFPKR